MANLKRGHTMLGIGINRLGVGRVDELLGRPSEWQSCTMSAGSSVLMTQRSRARLPNAIDSGVLPRRARWLWLAHANALHTLVGGVAGMGRHRVNPQWGYANDSNAQLGRVIEHSYCGICTSWPWRPSTNRYARNWVVCVNTLDIHNTKCHARHHCIRLAFHITTQLSEVSRHYGIIQHCQSRCRTQQ